MTKIRYSEKTLSLLQPTIILIVLVFTAQVLSQGGFINSNNFVNIIRQNTLLLFVALAEFVIILTGGIDLSVGAITALSSVLFVLFQGYNVGFALGLCLFAGIVVGLFNGILITYLNLPPFVITLAMQQIVYSVAKVMTNGAKVEHSLNGEMIHTSVLSFYKMDFLGVIIPIWICLFVICLLFIFIKTKNGHYLYAIGGNINAAQLCGLPVKKVKVIAYVVSGLLSAFAGFLFVARVSTGDPDTGTLLSMDAIAVCTIGGASLIGGRGTVLGTVIGLLTLCVLNNVMSLIHISPDVQPLVKGLVILLTVFLNSVKKKGER